MKRQNENMKLKGTARKDFVFADPLLPFGTIREASAHCTHLQITQANPQTNICKRVQSCLYTVKILFYICLVRFELT